MPHLPLSLRAWPGEQFAATLKLEIENLPSGSLPLAEGGALGGYIDDDSVTTTLLHCQETPTGLHLEVGVFYGEILAGCSCSEEPETLQTYCELVIQIDKPDAEAHISLRSPR